MVESARRRPSVRTRLRTEDVTCWVEHNQPALVPISENPHVRFEAPQTHEDDSDSESSDGPDEEPRYEDGGYGWVVVALSFTMHFILDGTSFSFGVIFPKIQEHFGSERTGASVAASFFLACPLMLAPFAAFITDVLECKRTIILGATMSFVSSFLSTFCPEIGTFSVVFGLGCGIGLSLIYNAAIVIVTYYFNKKRGKATALAVSGTGCGTFFFPFYLNAFVYLTQDFTTGLNSQLYALVFAFGIIMIIGFVVRDVEWYSDTREFKVKKFEKDVRRMLEEQESLAASKAEKPIRRAISLPTVPFSLIGRRLGETQSVQSIRDACNQQMEQPVRSKSVGIFIRRDTLPTVPEYSMLNSGLEHLEHLDLHLSNSPCTTVKSIRKRMLSKTSMSVDRVNEIDGDDDLRLNLHSSSSNLTHQEIASGQNDENEESSSDSEISNDGDSSSSEISDQPDKKTLVSPKDTALILRQSAVNGVSSVPTSARFVRTSLAPGTSGISGGRIIASNAIQPRSSRVHYTSNLLTMGKIPSAPQLNARKKRRNFFAKKREQWRKYRANELKNYKQLLKQPSFIYFLMSVFFLYSILDVPYVYFFDHAVFNLKIDENQAMYLTSSIGFSNILSTYVYGYMSDSSFFKDRILVVYAIALLGVAVSMIGAALVNSFWSLVAVSSLFGISVSSNYVFQSVILTHLFDDISVFQGSYALTSMIEGLACLCGPILIGLLRDRTGTYVMVFYISSAVAILSSIMALKSNRNHIKEMEEEEELDRQESTKSTDKRVHKICKNYKSNLRKNIQTKGTVLFMQNSTVSKFWNSFSGNSTSRALRNGAGFPEIDKLLKKV